MVLEQAGGSFVEVALQTLLVEDRCRLEAVAAVVGRAAVYLGREAD